VVCKHSGRGVSGSPSNDVRLEAPMRAIREASTRRKRFSRPRMAETGPRLLRTDPPKPLQLIAVGSEDLRT
jgi:hypothetical protein